MIPSRCIRLTTVAVSLALAIPATFASTPAGTIAAGPANDRFIVTYREGSNERAHRDAALQSVRAATSRAGLDRATRSSNGIDVAPLSVTYQRKLAVGADLVRTSRKLGPADAKALMQQIAADPAVVHVEPDVLMHPVRDFKAEVGVVPRAFVPDDPDYARDQWHFFDPVGGARVDQAWDLADGRRIVVAVLDTGITHHPDLDLSLADAGYDFTSESIISGRETDGRAPGGWDTGDWTTGDAYASCRDPGDPGEASSWHGTHVSGTIAELTNNGIGLAGIAHKARILPVRVLGHCGGYTADVADGIVWAAGGHVEGVPDNANPAQVINMSLGAGGTCTASDITGQAIAGALARGTTVVVAAGNSGADAANYSPASCPGAITVGSNGITGKRAFYSNYGANVAVAAPGGGIYPNDGSTGTPVANGFIWSTINAGTTTPADAVYGAMAGTSQASPHVAGTVALILSATEEAGLDTPSPAAIRTLLTTTARRFPVTPDRPIGAGIVDAYAAVNKALGNDDGGGDEEAQPLVKGRILGGQNAGTDATLLYSIEVPAGARALNLRSFGGSGDVSLFVAAGTAPTADGGTAQYRSVKPGNSEAVVIASPQATTYYIRVVGVAAFANVSVLADYTL